MTAALEAPREHNTLVAKTEFDRETQIIEEALRLFGQTGYHGTSLQGIAASLGITRPAFYYYFRSKDDLLWRLIGTLGDQLLEDVRPILKESLTPQQKLRKLIATHVIAILREPDAFKVYFAERYALGGQRDRRLRKGESQYMRLYERIISEGQAAGVFRSGEVHLLALIVTNFANSTLRWFQRRGALSPTDASKLVSEMAVAAISTRQSPIASPRSARRRSDRTRATGRRTSLERTSGSSPSG